MSLALGIDPTEISYDERAVQDICSTALKNSFSQCSLAVPDHQCTKRGLKDISSSRLLFMQRAGNRFYLSAPGARFGFIKNVKTWPRRISQMTPKSPCIALHATGWQNGGRLNGELSVGIFVPWEHTIP